MAAFVELRDDLFVARCLVVATYMACRSLGSSSEQAALCVISDAARDKLENTLGQLDALIAGASGRPKASARAKLPKASA